jgi:hypothetical protein
MYRRFVHGLGTLLEQIKIDGVVGNHIAGYSGVWTSNRNGRPAYSKPSECEANGSGCESMREFNDIFPGVQEKQPTWACLWLLSYECADSNASSFRY